MSTPQPNPEIGLLPRAHVRSTALRGAGIIYPAGDPAFEAMAADLARAIGQRCGVVPECAGDTALMPSRSDPLPEAWRNRSVFLLGNLNTNRALLRPYADFLCSTDASYPGGDGYDLRTMVNPLGAGFNMVLAGGSSARGVARAVGRLVGRISGLGPPFALPFLLDLELDPSIAAQLASWPQTPLLDSDEMKASRSRAHMFTTEFIRAIGSYTLMWSWTGDERYAAIACANLRALNARVGDGYGDWHYLAERFIRAIPILAAGGFLTDAEIARTDGLLLNTALATQDEWWRMRASTPPLGHRHHGRGTYEFLLLARYLRDQARPSPALRSLCERWIAECRTFLDAMTVARLDDQDDESTLNNVAMLYRYALGEERHGFFASGAARLVAERCLALHDNNGAGAGQGGYAEGLPGSTYYQQEATIQVAATAFYHGDGELKWILQSMPNLSVSQRYCFIQFTPACMQKFDTGPELAPSRPERFRGIQCLPLTDHQQAINTSPPENIEFAGHMVNALETWQMPEGVGLSRLAQAGGFDKIVLRGGFGRDDPYILLQGYQGGFRWQGHMQAANCIVRFYQAGHIFLVQNTWRHSHHDKNGIHISNGANEVPMPPIAARLAVDDFGPIGMTVTRLAGCHGATWTRHLFWHKQGGGSFVVIDRVEFEADGPYAVTCTWRTPGHAELIGRRWRAEQGRHRFTLVSGADVPMTSEEEGDQGATAPYVLRQRIAGEFRKGAETSFQNLFHVRELESTVDLDLRRQDSRSALVMDGGAAAAWCGVALIAATAWLPGVVALAESAWVSERQIALAGASLFSIAGEMIRITSDRPFGMFLDLAAGRLTLNPDGPSSAGARVAVALGDLARHVVLDAPVALEVPGGLCARVSAAVKAWLAIAAGKTAEGNPANFPAAEDAGWTGAWTSDAGTRLPERIRNLRVTADPLPVDGYPDQLIDGVLPELREIWRQWPAADRYTVRIELPEPRAVTKVNVLGDCIDDPTLRAFSPLPEGIRLDAETPDGRWIPCPLTPAPDRRYKRYRDAESRLEARTAEVGRRVRGLRLTAPAPARGAPFVLHEIEVFGDRPAAPAVTHWLAADINGDGRPEIVVFNSADELLALDDRGAELWRRQMPVSLTHLSCQQLDRDGPPALCAGLLGGTLEVLNADGSSRASYRITEDFRGGKGDALQGWFNAIHSLAIWHRDASGRGALVVGGYAIIVFLDTEGRLIGHSFADGPWTTDILVAPENRADRGDLYVRVGWNHGIMQYQGREGTEPSGATLNFGGYLQPMFRKLRRITPFVNGRTIAYAWVDLPSCPEGALFAATELGCGVFSVRSGDWLWKLEGGISLTAALPGRVDGCAAALLGSADGFVVALDLVTGRTIRRVHAGSPVVGLMQPPRSEFVGVATRAGMRLLDAAWGLRGALRRPLRRMLALGDGRVVVVRDDQSLELLERVGKLEP